MKQYKHPKLGIWKVTQQQFSDVYTDVNKFSIASPNGGRMNDVSTEELLALGFEEVEEEKDWIDSAIKEMEQYFTYNETGVCLMSMPQQYLRYNKTDLRQVLEKHIPPQKKFTGNDVHEHSMKTYGSDSGFYVNFTLNFLRDHDLLEE